MLDFTITEEQEAIVKMVREFSQKVIRPRVREMDDNEAIPDEILKGLAEQGIFGMAFKKEYGGGGMDPITVGLVAEEMAKADLTCAIPVFFLVQTAWGHVLQKYGTEEAKKELIPKVCKGEIFLGIGSTEPGCGSDVMSIKTKAEDKGDHYVLNGEKMYISGVREVIEQMPDGGGHLSIIKTDPDAGAKGLTLMYVPLKSEGIKTTVLEDWGRRGISTGGFAMDNVKIPKKYVVGEVGSGFKYLMQGFDYARAIIALVCCGAAQAGMQEAIEYIKQRETFGKPLAKYEGVQFVLAENWALIDAIRLLALKSLWMYDQEQNHGNFDRFEVTHTIAEAKMLGPVYGFKALNESMQWFGAFGYTKECNIDLGLRGIRSYQWAEGATEILKMIIARGLLGKEFVPTKK